MLILASQSPRRQELLQLIDPAFRVLLPQVDEYIPPGTPPGEAVGQLARRKAEEVWSRCGRELSREDLVIGADTVVALGSEILGKPADSAEAGAMLRKLSGQVHTVYTGVAIAGKDGCESFVQSTQVEFTRMSERQIQEYVATGEPLDKAGAYGIQGKGALFIRGIQGDFYTVMGLPVCKLAEKLAERRANA